jgi:3-dehydroquinate synthase
VAALEEIVTWNCRLKAAVVAADEREAGLRAILNYGHTVGHAVERAASYGTYTHGEAVALGMNAEAGLARRRGYIGQSVHERQQRLLTRFGLPGRFREPIDADEIIAAMRRDKKIQSGRLRFVLPETIGAVSIVDDVTDEELRAVLADLQP